MKSDCLKILFLNIVMNISVKFLSGIASETLAKDWNLIFVKF